MAARPSMAELIVRCRRTIGDPAGGTPVWSDDELQDALDVHRGDVRYLELTAAASIAAGGGVTVLDYYAPWGDWETDEVLKSNTYATIVPATSDRLTGHWTFSAHQPPPAYIVGKTYDLAAAAADVLEAWAGKVKLEFDFAADGQSYQRSQQAAALLELAAKYRRQQRATCALQVRSDLASGCGEAGASGSAGWGW